jgi:hypothetical protein
MTAGDGGTAGGQLATGQEPVLPVAAWASEPIECATDPVSRTLYIRWLLWVRNWETMGGIHEPLAGSRAWQTSPIDESFPMKILFLHGWTSVPGGIKPTFLKDHGQTVFNPELPDEDFEEAVRIAQEEFDKHQPEVVVGSSRGGAVAMNIDSGDARLVLLCPAWKRWGTARTVKLGTVILHSRADDVIPFGDSEELVRTSGLPTSALIEVGTDHRLADPEPLERMLKECDPS